MHLQLYSTSVALRPCGPVAFRPCGGGHLTGLLQGAPAQERWLGACRTATSRKTAQMLRALAHRRSASLSALFFLLVSVSSGAA